MITRKDYQITSWCRRMMKEHIQEGSLCIDATMGNGNDTEYLCRLVGENGKVLAFDIQPEALANTRTRLEALRECAAGGRCGTASSKDLVCCENYQLILDSHSHMNQYAQEESADCIVFNLGYLPGGDHSLATKAQTTIEALEQGLLILKKNGLMSVCIYSGGDSGFEEKDAVMAWLKGLDCRKYLVLVTEYYNRPNNPPVPVLIVKL